ncbi:Sporulation-like domain containing protein [Rhabdaerophilaceae bacterium]
MKDESRREPTLADLEAFERLLRDGLNSGRASGTQNDAAPGPSAAISADSALAEFNRLIATPVSLDPQAPLEAPQQLSQIEKSLRADLASPPPPMSEAARDPMLDFEDELRRFEALSRPHVNNPVEPEQDFQAPYPNQIAPQAAMPYANHGQPSHDPSEMPQMSTIAEWQDEQAIPLSEPQRDVLEAAEDRLAAEAQAGAVAGGAAVLAGAALAANSRARSRGVFYALGGVAIVGLSVLGGLSMLSGKPRSSAGGDVPVIAAKQEPTKERPANPGGLEVPDQNKQVLAPKTAAADPKPAQVVTQTEQPVDLNQIARRESVRVVAPSPFQQPASTPAPAPEPAAAPAPAPESAAAPAATPPAVEPRRVQSVRLADQPAPQPSPTPTSPSTGAVVAGVAGAASIAAIAAGTLTPSRPTAAPTTTVPPGAAAAIRPATPQPAVTPAQRPVQPAPPLPAVPEPAATQSKAESRPQSPVAPATRPPAPPRPQPAAPRAAAAPLELAPVARPAQPTRTASAPTTAGSGFAIQLASRPSDSDARSAGQQLGSRYSEAIGGRSPVVVRGEANGRTVYRVRVTGFSQSDANAACDRVRASGGACFVTRQ